MPTVAGPLKRQINLMLQRFVKRTGFAITGIKSSGQETVDTERISFETAIRRIAVGIVTDGFR